MSFVVGKIAFGQNVNSTIATRKPIPIFDWDISLFHQDGGLKKQWFLGQSDNPIRSINFELTEKLMGAGSIEFSFLDFPIDADDFILIKYRNSSVYRGFVDNTVDPKGGKVKLVPFHVKFARLLINDNFASKTVEQMLQTIVEALESDTTIDYLSSLINTGESTTYSFDYSGYEPAKKVIDELVKKLDDRKWGTNADNQFVVYQPDTATTEAFFYVDRPKYSIVNAKTNWDKVKATRYQVFKKTTGAGESARIGQVGYDSGAFVAGSNWPTPSIEDFISKREGKFVVSEVIASNGDALDLAFQNLLVETAVPENIKALNFNIETLFDKLTVSPIGKRIKVQDKDEFIQRTIINCDALTADDTTMNGTLGSWSGVTLDTSDFITGSNSVTFATGSAVYDLGRTIVFNNPVTIGFMIKGSVSGQYLEMSTGINGAPSQLDVNTSGGVTDLVVKTSGGNSNFKVLTDGSNDLWDTTIPLNITTSALWTFLDFGVIQTSFRFFGIRFTDATVSTVNLDRIQLYLIDRSEYTQNIIKIPFSLTNSNQNATIELKEYDLQANDVIFAANKKIEKLEAVQQDN